MDARNALIDVYTRVRKDEKSVYRHKKVVSIHQLVLANIHLTRSWDDVRKLYEECGMAVLQSDQLPAAVTKALNVLVDEAQLTSPTFVIRNENG